MLLALVGAFLGWLSEYTRRRDMYEWAQRVSNRAVSIEWQLEQHGFVFNDVPDTEGQDVTIYLARPELLHRPNGYLQFPDPADEDENSTDALSPD